MGLNDAGEEPVGHYVPVIGLVVSHMNRLSEVVRRARCPPAIVREDGNNHIAIRADRTRIDPSQHKQWAAVLAEFIIRDELDDLIQDR